MTPGPKNLITDIPGILVGHASDEVTNSGTTVLTANQRLAAGVHVMGGAPGTRETDLLAPDKLVSHIDAITLSGGSAFGLDAATGVMEALKAQKRGYEVGPNHIPIVPAAIIYDLQTGDNGWTSSPYPSLGRQAFEAASTSFALGSVGAGTGAIAGRDKGGTGSASLVLPGGTTIGALVIANPLGNTRSPEGQFYAAPFELDGEFGNILPPGPQALATTFATKGNPQPLTNTTIAVVATDASLTKSELTRLATVAHDGFAKAINPSHTPFDGDLIFAVSTEKRPALSPQEQLYVGHGAAITVARATARAVYEANR